MTTLITKTAPPCAFTLSTIINESGLDNGGSQATTNLEYGALSGLPAGWTIVGAGGTAVDYGKLTQHDGAWKFQLTEAVTHAPGQGANLLAPENKATVLVKDAAGNQYEVALKVNIVDNISSIKGASALKVTGGNDVDSNLSIIYGADGKAASNHLAIAGATPSSVEGDVATYALEHGSLKLNTSTGKYTFTANGIPLGVNSNNVQKITFVASDGDGDSSTRAVSITISKPVLPCGISISTIVNEAGLDNGGSMPDSNIEFGSILNLPAGWTIINTGSTTVDYGQMINDNGAWSFQLTSPVIHPEGEGSNTLSHASRPTLIIQDAAGNQYEVPVNINIIDDVPMISGNGAEEVGAGDTLTASLDLQYGADGQASANNVTVEGAIPDYISGAIASYTLSHGTLNLNISTGEYTFIANELANNVNSDIQNIVFVIKDADGDTDKLDVAITINNWIPCGLVISAIVNEAGLDINGSMADANIEFGQLSGLPEGWTIIGAGSTAVDYGNILVDGDSWQFQLTQAMQHSDNDGANFANPLNKPTIIIQSPEGKQVEVQVEITVIDDVPEFYSTANENIDLTHVLYSPVSVAGNLEFTFGADGAATENAITWDLSTLTELTSNGASLTFKQENGVLTAQAEGETVFVVSINENGDYKYTQYKTLDNADNLQLGLQLKDADNDVLESGIVLEIELENQSSTCPLEAQDDRFVMYTGSNANGHAITGNILFNDLDSTATLLGVTNGTYGTAKIGDNGEVTYTLDSNATALMAADASSVRDYLTYNALDSNGVEYSQTIEVVIVRDNNKAEIYMSDNKINGETHQDYLYVGGDADLSTLELLLSDGDDVFRNIGLSYDVVDVREGNNDIYISSGGYGVYDSSIIAGDGQNHIVLNSSQHTMYLSSLIMGDGGNTVDINCPGRYGTIMSSIISGAGDDVINITASQGVIYNNNINTGAGDDIIKVQASVYAMEAAYGEVNEINGGNGNDFISVEGANCLYDRGGINHVFGGAGDDIIALRGSMIGSAVNNLVDGGLGDMDELCLKLDGSMSALGVMSNATATNFEAIALDLMGSSNDNLVLTQEMINNLQKMGWETAEEQGSGAASSIYIRGDANDKVDMSQIDASWVQSNTVVHNDITYNQWVDDQDHNLFIMQQMLTS